MTEWQSRAVHVLIEQLGVKNAQWAAEISGKFERGESLRLEEVELMTKVIGIIGLAAVASTIVRPNTAAVVQAAGYAGAGMMRAARGRVNCERLYPLMTDSRQTCHLESGHGGLHVQDNGFAWSEEDQAWATEQMRLIQG